MFGCQGREENGPWCESLSEERQNETPLRNVAERGFLRRAGEETFMSGFGLGKM